MNFSFLASFVAALGLCSIIIRHSIKRDLPDNTAFWEKEAKANFTRKKSLDSLNYIQIPQELLQCEIPNCTPELSSYLASLRQLSQEKIVNLSGFSNTDLKLAYGTANITILSQYDANYTDLVVLLQKIAQALVNHHCEQQAMLFLEYAISIGSDVRATYILLASLYKTCGYPEKILQLQAQAEQLNTLLKDSIVRTLQASGQ